MKNEDMTISSIRFRGNKALFAELGPVGFVRYMQQFVGRGDYGKDREKWIDRLDVSRWQSAASRLQKQGKNRLKTGK